MFSHVWMQSLKCKCALRGCCWSNSSCLCDTWWRHQMETFSALLALCAGNSLICARINGWVNNREAGDLWHHRAHYDVTVMKHRENTHPATVRCDRLHRDYIDPVKANSASWEPPSLYYNSIIWQIHDKRCCLTAYHSSAAQELPHLSHC